MKSPLISIVLLICLSACTSHYNEGENLFIKGVRKKEKNTLINAKIKLSKIDLNDENYAQGQKLILKIDSIIEAWNEIERETQLSYFNFNSIETSYRPTFEFVRQNPDWRPWNDKHQPSFILSPGVINLNDIFAFFNKFQSEYIEGVWEIDEIRKNKQQGEKQKIVIIRIGDELKLFLGGYNKKEFRQFRLLADVALQEKKNSNSDLSWTADLNLRREIDIHGTFKKTYKPSIFERHADNLGRNDKNSYISVKGYINYSNNTGKLECFLMDSTILFTAIRWKEYGLMSDDIINVMLKEASYEINQSCPIVIDKETTLISSVAAEGKLIYKYKFNLNEFLKDFKSSESEWIDLQTGILTNAYCTEPTLKLYKDYDVPLMYEYCDLEGKHIVDIEIQSSDCN